MTAKHQKIANNEISASEYLRYSSAISDAVVKTLDGAYLTTWRVDGIAFETRDAIDLDILHEAFNQLLIGLGEVAIWSHRVRRQYSDQFTTEYQNPFANTLAKRYYASFKGYNMMGNETYLTLVYRPYGAVKKNLFGRVVDLQEKSLRAIEEADKHALRKIEELATRIQATLKKYDVERLATYQENNITYSNQLAFYGYLLNAVWEKVPVKDYRIRDVLQTSRLFFVEEKIEIRAPNKRRFIAMLDLKDYPANTDAGCMNSLLYTPYEYIETQSFSILDKPSAKDKLEKQRNQLVSTEDGAASQIKALDLAIDQLVDGQFVLGEYHYSLAVLGDNMDEATRNMAEARSALSHDGYQTALLDLVADAAWFAQQPAHWYLRPREAHLTSRNFAGLAAMHGFGTGKRDNNPWGEAVTILKTPNGAPYYFNFHGTDESDDSTDKKAPGNTTIIGMTGSGKTVLELFLLLMTLKYQPTIVFFDKDRGAEIVIRALGGNYRLLKKGIPTGFNPFQLEETEHNISFLVKLVQSLVPYPLNATDSHEVERAVRVMMTFERSKRGLYAINQQLPNTKQNSVHDYLQKWCRGGSYGWVLDNVEDQIDLSQGRLFGFDDTAFLEDKDILAPVTMYLLHLTESLIDGRRFIYVMAEFWKRLELSEFTDFAVNKQFTIRKQNGFGIFDTQSPAQILKTPHVAAMVEQCATQIFLPNPKANYHDYVEGFKVTEMEYHTIRTLGETSRQFLVKQGHTSTVVTLDLGSLNEMLDVLSTSLDNVEMLDAIRAEVGDDVQDWMPIYLNRLAQRKAMTKANKGRVSQ